MKLGTEARAMARSRRSRAAARRLKYAADHTLMATPFLHTNTTGAGARTSAIGSALTMNAIAPPSSATAANATGPTLME